MSPKERSVMKEPLLDMVWNEDGDYDAYCLDLSDSCVVTQVFRVFFFHGFMALSCIVPHPHIMLVYMSLLYLILEVPVYRLYISSFSLFLRR